jgi:fructose-specific phosphotransferase system component IIB
MEVAIEGLITRFVAATDFDVAGKPVTTTSTTRFENGSAADLALNVKVEAEGQLNTSGVLVATKVQFKRQGSARIEARVDSVDRAANKFVVLGIDVTVNANTRVEDKGDQRVASFNLGNIAAGDFVEVRGAELPADSNDVVASRLERRRAENEVRLRGIVDSATSPSFTILGVTIQTTAGTDFEGTSAADFFTEAVGRIAQVKGTVSGGVFTAREVEFEND